MRRKRRRKRWRTRTRWKKHEEEGEDENDEGEEEEEEEDNRRECDDDYCNSDHFFFRWVHPFLCESVSVRQMVRPSVGWSVGP